MQNRLVFLLFAAASLWGQASPFLTPPAASALSGDPEVALVDGRSIKVSDVRKMLESSSPQQLQYFKQNPQSAIQQYFLLKFLAVEGDKAKLAEQSPLKEQIELARAQAVALAQVNNIRDGYGVTPEMIQLFYDRNKSRYEQAKVKMIYVAFKACDTSGLSPEQAAQKAVECANAKNGRGEADAKKRIDEVYAKLKKGAKFEDMVAEYSDDEESKKAGGDFGKPISSTSAYPEDVKKAVLSLNTGEMTEPIKQSNGYFILKVQEKTAQSIAEVTEPIVQEIRQTHLDDYMKGLTARFNPVIKNPDFFVKPDSFLNPPAK